MRKSRPRFRNSSIARWLVISVVAVGVMVFTVSAWMASNSRARRDAAPKTAERVRAEIEKKLFVDEDSRERKAHALEIAAAAPGGQTTAEVGESFSYEIPKIAPAVFRGDVRSLPQVPQPEREGPEFEGPLSAKKFLPNSQNPEQVHPNIPLAPMPNPAQNFPGVSRLDLATNGSGQLGAGTPPDTNGDVGPNHYIQAVNSGFGIFNKTGTLLASFTENSLFAAGPTGTICDTNSGGDPVVLYDSLADRWILTNFAFTGAATVGPFYECIAASRTADPVSGGWNLYAIRGDTGLAGQPPVNTFPDYPHFGVWTDCLYYAANGFNSAGSYTGGIFGSFSRADMYSGAALTASLGYSASASDFFTMMPSNLSAPAAGLPPAGRLNLFVQESLTAFNYRVRTFTPGTNCGGTGTLSAATTVSQTSYTAAGTDVPQPNTANLLDSLSDRIMQKSQYRNVGGVESLWVTHTGRTTVGPDTSDKPQWAQINVTGGVIAAAPVQEQIYAPDTTLYRWMPSIAADKDGNVALAYSTSNGTSPNFPSIAYSGRLVGDPLNQLPQSETQLIAGSGSQTGNCGGAPCHRWGDYSSLSVDPTDSCTFWFTSEYLTSQTNGATTSPIWSTRIGSFVFPSCVAAASVPTVPATPTNLTFTGVTQFAMTLNWNDIASNEDSYIIYRSTDNINFSFAALTAANATSQAVGGLTPNTTYFWKVYAATKGALSGQLTGSQATLAPATISCNGAGGNWSSPATWVGGVLPTSGDNVVVASGCTLTIDTAAVAFNLTINNTGILQFETTTARSLTTTGDVTIDSGGTFQSATTGTQTGHTLSLAGNLTNNGTLDFSTNGNTAGAGITFTGATNNTFGGTGGTTDIRTLTINKGTSFANILELNPTNFTVQSLNASVPVFLTLTNGTLKVSGSFSFTSLMFTPAGYTIGATTGFWLNNPNFTVIGQGGSPTQSGLLRVSQGTFNIGTGTGNSMGLSAGSTTIVEGGAVNATGRFGVGAAGNAINYTQSGGTITACTIGTSSTTLACFDLGTSLSSVVGISGGTIVLQIPNAGASGPRDYRNQAGAGVTGVTGGTLQLGNAGSGAAKTFILRGILPLNTVVTNTSAGHTGQMDTTLVNYNNVGQNITINSGATFNTANVIFLETGNVTNNGTLTSTGASSRYYNLGNGSAQTLSGTGVFTAPMTTFELDNPLGLTLTTTNQAVTNIIRLFNGSFTNANKLTLGSGGATTGTVQIGNTTTPTAAGTFDVAPTFNLGTGGQVIAYLRTTLTRTMGPEVNPSRSLTTFTYDDNDGTHALTMAGGDLTVTGTTNLTNGRVITGANTFIIGGAGTVVRTNGYIDGNFRKNYTAAASKVFEVGTANGFSPVTVNVTAGTLPTDFTVKAVQGPQPNMLVPSKALQRYWTLNATGVTADLTFNYLDPTDIPVTANENNFIIFKYSGSFTAPGGSVNAAANQATITGVSSFSDWSLAEPSGPTAAPATISGQISTIDGLPLAGVTMTMTGNKSMRTITDSQGNYRFPNVDTNNFYSISPSLMNYHFSPSERSFSLTGNKTDALFTATRDAVIIGNAIDSPDYFVRQHYLDFLGRESDDAGFNFWSNEISSCGSNANCVEAKRINVSAAYFLSIEFQETGGLVDGLYRISFARAPRYAEFEPDAATIGQNVIVGRGDWSQQLATNKQAFLDAFVARPGFQSVYGNLSNNQYVNQLLTNTRIIWTQTQRDALVNNLNSGTQTRAGVLGQIAGDQRFINAKRNEMFVMMEYFGYLRRDPDEDGYQFWLNKLNQFDGNFERAEMVKAFIVSREYRQRFAR